jgi:aspartyl-tRNA(Asn)/glutamyl-tRNA(Gln) amidotransferase subunit B
MLVQHRWGRGCRRQSALQHGLAPRIGHLDEAPRALGLVGREGDHELLAVAEPDDQSWQVDQSVRLRIRYGNLGHPVVGEIDILDTDVIEVELEVVLLPTPAVKRFNGSHAPPDRLGTPAGARSSYATGAPWNRGVRRIEALGFPVSWQRMDERQSVGVKTAEEFETVIGLECHVELSTATKMFCGCPNVFGAAPNTHVCEVCLGHPGSLPVPNERAIEYTIRIGLALGCEIVLRSLFHRKNYFYPDMPKNYQISQYDLPLCRAGHLDVEVEGEARRIGITRVHLEEDTGKTTHAGATGRIAGSDYALVDYNRAGVPLVEVVSEPDIRSVEEARTYFLELRDTLEALGVSDVRMEEGSLRCDTNVSVRQWGSEELGTKVEIKNLNSVRSLERALRYEIDRQIGVLREGGALVQETRHFDENIGVTSPLRSKEYAFDYRYFPEPDLPPVEPDAEWIDRIRESLPELPTARRARFVDQYGLKPVQARMLGGSKLWADFFEEAVSESAAPPAAANWMTQDLAALLNDARQHISESKVRPKHLADIIRLVEEGTISSTGGKVVLAEVFSSGRDAAAIVEEKGLRQVSDTSALEGVIAEVLAEHEDAATQYRGGKETVINFLFGQVMKKTRGSANPRVARDLLRERLSQS